MMHVVRAEQGMWVRGVHVSHQTVLSLFRPWLPPMGPLPAYDLFFSYRRVITIVLLLSE